MKRRSFFGGGGGGGEGGLPLVGLAEKRDWIGGAMKGWYGWWAGHRILLTVVLGVLGVVFSVLGARVRWQADILAFFSADSAEVANMRGAGGEGGIANQLRVDLHWMSHENGVDERQSVGALRAAAEDLARRLRATGLLAKVWTGVDERGAMGAYEELAREGPELLTEHDLATLDRRLDEHYLKKRFAGVAATMADPDGEVRARQLRSDPLDVRGLVSEKMQGMALGGAGGGAGFEEGLLVSADRQHAMLVLEPRAAATDMAGEGGAEAVVDGVEKVLREFGGAHAGMGTWLVGAHRSYVENGRRIRRDISLVSLAGTLGIAVVLWIYFRRVGAVILCLLGPAVGMGVALGVAGIFRAELPLIALGFTGLLCGSTTDYGIQLLTALRGRVEANEGRFRTEWVGETARELFGPISMSVVTSVTAFAGLGLSHSPGLRALGFFVAGTTVCIWGLTFLVLPIYFGERVFVRGDLTGQEKKRAEGGWTTGWRFVLTGAFILVTGYLGVRAFGVRFVSDAASLDGSSAELQGEEGAFYNTWGDLRHRAIVVVEGAEAEGTLVRLGQVYAMLEGQQHDGLVEHVVSAAGLLPPDAAMLAAGKRWEDFWTPERMGRLRRGISVAASAAGFRPSAWDSTIAGIRDAPAEKSAGERVAVSPAALLPGLIWRDGERTAIASVVELGAKGESLEPGVRRRTEPSGAFADELRLRFGDVAIISGDLLFADASARARAETESLGPWCFLLILIPLWVYFRRIGWAWTAFTALLGGLVWVLGAAVVFGGGLNLLSLVPLLFTIGVTIDYGIYAATDAEGGRARATLLCATTTFIGVGALVLASHPVLRWLGVTLSAGILGGYLTSVVVVRPVVRWMGQSKYGRVMRWVGGAGRLGLVGMTGAIAVVPVAEMMMRWSKPAGVKRAAGAAVREISPTVFTVGNNWMRKRTYGGLEPLTHEGVWEISLGGTPEEVGDAGAKLGGPMDSRIEAEMLDQLDLLVANEFARYLLTRAVAINLLDLPGYIPGYLQREIYAASQAHADLRNYLAPTYPRLLSYHALHDISQMLIDNPLLTAPPEGVVPAAACTGVVSLPGYSSGGEGGHFFLARDFDFEGGISFDRQKSVTYVFPEGANEIPFATVAWPGLSGVVTGVNRERIGLFINAAATSDFRRIGTPTILVARDVLQHAKTLEDAERIIGEARVFVSDIIVVGDGKTNEAVIIEKSPGAMAVRKVEGSAVVTNHLVSERFRGDATNLDRMARGTTVARYQRGRQLLDGLRQRVTPLALAGLLRDKRGVDGKDVGLGNRNTIDALIASHGVIFDLTAGKIWVATYPHVEGAFLCFDVGKMLGRGPGALRETGEDGEGTEDIGPDEILADGRWEQFIASSAALAEAQGDLRRGDFGGAEKRARAAIAGNPRYYEAHEALAGALAGRGDKAGARAEAQTAMGLDPPATHQGYLESFFK